jgi:hypothetical protein
MARELLNFRPQDPPSLSDSNVTFGLLTKFNGTLTLDQFYSIPAGLYISDLSPLLTIKVFLKSQKEVHNVVSHTYAPAPFLMLNLTFG